MSLESFGGFKKSEQPDNLLPGAEKLEGFHLKLWSRMKALFKKLNITFADSEMQKDSLEKIRRIENNSEDDKFLDLEVVGPEGEQLQLRVVAQIDESYEPNRKKNYDEWDLTPEEEARRWLNREIIVNEKLAQYLGDSNISADTVVESNRDFYETMFLLKQTKEQTCEWESYGEAEGRAAACALLGLQENLQATEMVKEIMRENKIKSKLELEQKIFEDYFDHFKGYMDNSQVILNELGDPELAAKIKSQMIEYREIIEKQQLGEEEYCLVHGNINLETVKYTEDREAYLSNWQRAGTTQNRELSLVYDLGDLFNDVVKKFTDVEQAKKFISGVEVELKEHYKDNPDIARAVMLLAKLRSFAVIVNEIEEDRQKFVRQELGIT